MLKRLEALIRSPLGRIFAGAVGFAVLAFQVRRSGTDAVLAAVARSPGLFPVVVALEAGVAGCEVWALYHLYGAERRKVPIGQLVRSGLISYSVMCMVPMGRAVAEATRAAMLSRYVGGARAAAAAARMQAMALLGNAAISLPCALGALALVGAHWLPAFIAANFVITLALGGGVLFVGRRSRLGAWLNARVGRGQQWGAAFDQHLRGAEAVPLSPIAWVFLGRCFQTTQRVVLLFAVGASVGVLQGMCAEGIHLVSGSVGDMIPSQVGITEAIYELSSSILGISKSDGVALALIAHMAQLFWLLVGSIVPLLWPAPPPAPT
jgi:hypothetical protein